MNVLYVGPFIFIGLLFAYSFRAAKYYQLLDKQMGKEAKKAKDVMMGYHASQYRGTALLWKIESITMLILLYKVGGGISAKLIGMTIGCVIMAIYCYIKPIRPEHLQLRSKTSCKQKPEKRLFV